VTAAGTPLEVVPASLPEAGPDEADVDADEAFGAELEDELEHPATSMIAAMSATAAAAILGSRAA
jgi:hypothetical protein